MMSGETRISFPAVFRSIFGGIVNYGFNQIAEYFGFSEYDKLEFHNCDTIWQYKVKI